MTKPPFRKVQPPPKAPSAEQAERAEKFQVFVDYITERGGWLVSAPGESEIRIECLPSSDLPDALRKIGHDVRPDVPPDGERIIAGRICRVQKFYFAFSMDGTAKDH